MGLNLTDEQYRLIFSAVRKYQQMNFIDHKTWEDCDQVLDELFPYAYTQRLEQVR
jgi:hemerythrin